MISNAAALSGCLSFGGQGMNQWCCRSSASGRITVNQATRVGSCKGLNVKAMFFPSASLTGPTVRSSGR